MFSRRAEDVWYPLATAAYEATVSLEAGPDKIRDGEGNFAHCSPPGCDRKVRT
jgi:hypothetical protein